LNDSPTSLQSKMDCEQCIARVAACPDTHSARCADSDALEIQNAPNRATCALDPAAAIRLRPRTQSRAHFDRPANRRSSRSPSISSAGSARRISRPGTPRSPACRWSAADHRPCGTGSRRRTDGSIDPARDWGSPGACRPPAARSLAAVAGSRRAGCRVVSEARGSS